MVSRQNGGAEPEADSVHQRGRRLDVELVRRGLARSRGHAVDLIVADAVYADGRSARRPSQRVSAATSIEVCATTEVTYVSRGAHKLAAALETFEQAGLQVARRRCLDAGASTGGFTDVLLERGARHVLAVDVGSDQLAQRLRDHPAVSVYEQTNLRHVRPGSFGEPVELVVVDVSFISVTLLLPALCGLAQADADFVVLVKPQFEVGRAGLSSAGVVTAAADRAAAVCAVMSAGRAVGLAVAGLTPSALQGGSGNREYFCWMRRSSVLEHESDTDWCAHIQRLCAREDAAATHPGPAAPPRDRGQVLDGRCRADLTRSDDVGDRLRGPT